MHRENVEYIRESLNIEYSGTLNVTDIFVQSMSKISGPPPHPFIDFNKLIRSYEYLTCTVQFTMYGICTICICTDIWYMTHSGFANLWSQIWDRDQVRGTICRSTFLVLMFFPVFPLLIYLHKKPNWVHIWFIVHLANFNKKYLFHCAFSNLQNHFYQIPEIYYFSCVL